MTTEQKVRRALTALDHAVQAWYAEHNPNNKEHYASATFMDDTEDGFHVSRITLNSDAAGKEFTDIKAGGYGNKKTRKASHL